MKKVNNGLDCVAMTHSIQKQLAIVHYDSMNKNMIVAEKTTLAQSTIQISWQLLYSCIRRTVEVSGERCSGFCLDALPNIILGCSALEAFSNEISSIASVLHSEELINPYSPSVLGLDSFDNIVGVSEEACRRMSAIKTDDRGNAWERYKNLCSALGIGFPQDNQDLCTLVQVRHGIVHFRACDLNIITRNGAIAYDHILPNFYNYLKGKKYHGCYLIFTEDVRQKVAEPGGIKWVDRISTPAVALWAIEVVIAGILHFIKNIPRGKLKLRVENAYSPANQDHQTLFHWGQSLIDERVRNVL
jgi:hypothetical protein